MSEHRPLHIADDEAPGALSDAAAARRALSEYDARAASLEQVRRRASYAETLDLDIFVDIGMFPRDAAGTTRRIASAADADQLALECARYTLLDKRRAALDALKRGFMGARDGADGALDMTRHLALFTPREVGLLVGGRERLDAAELTKLIEWPSDKDAHDLWGSLPKGQPSPSALLRKWISSFEGDEGEATCLDVFKCITGRRAVPVHGHLSIDLAAAVGADGRVYDGRAGAEAATCFNQLKLPRYETLAQLTAGMQRLLDEKNRFSAA